MLAELSEDSSNNLESKNLIFKDFPAADDIVYGDRIVPISDLLVNICNNNYKLGNAFNSSVYKDNRQLTLLKTGDYTVSFNVILNPGTSNEFTIDGSINLSGIAKRKIKLKVNDYEKKTSENPKFTYDVISGSFVDNDRAVLGTKQIEGTNNEFKIIVNKIVDGQGADVSDMYEVEANEGLLTVVEDSTEQGIKPWVWIVVGCLGGVLIALIALAIYLNIKIKNTDGEDKD